MQTPDKRRKSFFGRGIHRKIFGLVMGLLMMGCDPMSGFGPVQLHPTREFSDKEGNLYTPSTQSLLRTHSLLEKADELYIDMDDKNMASFQLALDQEDYYVNIKNIPIDHLVPRLHYPSANPPDEFDALNLMLAEYSRNSISVPLGNPGDEMSHYETNLAEKVPWKLDGDYHFIPNELYRPLRVSVINNCLAPTLWELNAIDRSGEIYHSWFNMPEDQYFRMVARTNKLPLEFVREALQWKEQEVKLDLGRLRGEVESFGTVNVSVKNENIGFSSQDSRRKLSKNFVLCHKGDTLVPPMELQDLHQVPVAMSSFVEPGVYSFEERTEFDFSYLAQPIGAEIRLVKPKTFYNWNEGRRIAKTEENKDYIEIHIQLPDREKIIIGNLPLHLLVQQEDFVLHGFGVGILDASDFAERRKFLIDRGPHPSFAYLVRQGDEDLYALNSHARGIEQIFIRSYPKAPVPYWEITITSYERIVDIVKYEVEIPEPLQEAQKEASMKYITPVYFSYRDDNIN